MGKFSIGKMKGEMNFFLWAGLCGGVWFHKNNIRQSESVLKLRGPRVLTLN